MFKKETSINITLGEMTPRWIYVHRAWIDTRTRLIVLMCLWDTSTLTRLQPQGASIGDHNNKEKSNSWNGKTFLLIGYATDIHTVVDL